MAKLSMALASIVAALAGILKGFNTQVQSTQSLKGLLGSIKPLGISDPEASLRWFIYYSALQNGDGFILGYSGVSQIQRNSENTRNVPLPQGGRCARGGMAGVEG